MNKHDEINNIYDIIFVCYGRAKNEKYPCELRRRYIAFAGKMYERISKLGGENERGI